MRRTLWRCVVGLLVLGLSAAVPAQSLQFYTEEYPPLNYSRDGRPVGLAVDLVRELFERTGDHGRISVVPWARGYQAAQLEPNTALFVTMRTAERERLFKWVGPVVVAVTSFYALRGSGIRIERFEDVARIGQVVVQLPGAAGAWSAQSGRSEGPAADDDHAASWSRAGGGGRQRDPGRPAGPG